jgi:hypothetical protein
VLVRSGARVWSGTLEPWGACWGSHWWVADFSGFTKPGTYAIELKRGSRTLLSGAGLELGRGLLFRKCFEPVALRQYELRSIFAAVRPGWFDAGMLWQEIPSHAASIVGLCDLVLHARDQMTPAERRQLLAHIDRGANYLELCQKAAGKLGHRGAVVHDLAKSPQSVCANDVFMAAIAWARAAQVMRAMRPARARRLAALAGQALDYVEMRATPVDPTHNMPWNQGWPQRRPWPRQWMTRYLLLALWSELILARLGLRKREDRIDALTDQILARQVPKERREHGLFGHFYAYDGSNVTEKGWSHGMPPKPKGRKPVFGSDMGAVFAHPVHAFIDGLRFFPAHRLAGRWHSALVAFAFGYFKPACLQNPFYLAPRGIFGREGLLHFSGLWHGCNALYGQAAALALEFNRLWPEDAWKQIATGNLQWICGLNAGLTQAASDIGCVMRRHEVPEGKAVPVSMIYDVGARTAGNWTTIAGSICNGFSAGKQFTYDVPPLKRLDAPSSLTDEDWITHAGGFLMGLARSGAER